MTYELPERKGPARDVAIQGGYLIGFSVQAIVGLLRSVFGRRLSMKGTVTQILFIGRVSTGPSLLLMIPIGSGAGPPADHHLRAPGLEH